MDDQGRGIARLGHPFRPHVRGLLSPAAYLPVDSGIDNAHCQALRRYANPTLARAAVQYLRTGKPALPGPPIRRQSRYRYRDRSGSEERYCPGRRPVGY